LEPLVRHRGKVARLNRVNVDTDQIIPKQFLKRVERSGFGQFLFYDWRFRPDGSINPEFELNQPQYSGASILVAGANFGCGSSREHAPWALLDYGFRIIIAPSFADIFYNNCFKNGILPIVLSQAEVDDLMEKALAPGYELEVDVERQTVTDGHGWVSTFSLDEFRRNMLLKGLDEIGLTLQYEAAIAEYERKRESLQPVL
jgi:3-isopropylmalate/(R)-2-methylmalate dehydratase small subunit